MADLPDISNLDSSALAQLAAQVNTQILQRRQEATSGLSTAEQRLLDLIGPNNPTAPSVNNLTEVQLFTDDQIRSNAALGLRLSFRATEVLARIVLHLVRYIGR